MSKNRIFGVCVVAFGLALFVVGVRRLVEPDYYQATVEIEIQSAAEDYDPNFLETEFSTIRSDIVLSNVFEKLNLNATWGKRHVNGKEFSAREAIKLLRREIYIENFPNTRLAEIRVRDDNPDEAATIANAIAEAYGNYREMEFGIEMLEKRYREVAADIAQIEANLKALEKESIVTDSHLSNEISLMKIALNDREDRRRFLGEKIKTGRVSAGDPDAALVTIVDPAVPPTTPAGPNRWLGAACLICGLIIVFVVCGCKALQGRVNVL